MVATGHTDEAREGQAGGADGHRAVRIWLMTVAALIFLMVIVGGATRLTDSGLSITEWQPIMGALPPMSDAAWQEAFAKYKEIPEYKIVNKGMSLDEFKSIFWWEWAHRFLGRFIGIAYFVPMLLFWRRGMLPDRYKPHFAGIFVLGGLQGALGWYMVKSGLVDRVDVSQYRLAAHLGLAVLIYGAVVWLVLRLSPAQGSASRSGAPRMARSLASLLVGLVFLQVMAGALVAGMHAGLIFPTWPDMNGDFVPQGLMAASPWILNFFENATTVQFDHRILAYVICAVAVWQLVVIMRAASEGAVALSAVLVCLAVFAQVGLGIWTLLSGVKLELALAHQAGAIVLFTATLWHLHLLKRQS